MLSCSPLVAALVGLFATDGGVRLQLATPPPETRAAPADRYDLRPAKDGTGDLLYEGSGFGARVSTDGTVAFKDKRAPGLSLLPSWFPVGAGNGLPSLQASLSSLLGKRKAPPVVEQVSPPDESFLVIPNVTPYRPDPREGCRTCDFRPIPFLVNPSGHFDLTDELTRFSPNDPHRLEKARFLETTRDLRIRMAARAHANWLRQASAELPGRLESIACDGRLTPGERRAILAALRDEMDATPEGRAAARTIESFVAARDGRRDAGDGCATVTGGR